MGLLLLRFCRTLVIRYMTGDLGEREVDGFKERGWGVRFRVLGRGRNIGRGE